MHSDPPPCSSSALQIVGWGTVPLLLPLLSPTAPTSSAKTRTFVLATLLQLAMHDVDRHGDVLCRCGGGK